MLSPIKIFDKKTDSILLIAMGFTDSSRYERETPFIQLGILYLGTVLKNNGYRVKLLITYYPDMENIKQRIKDEKVKIVGFYSTVENIYRNIRCAEILKNIYPDLIIVIGGPHAALADIDILEKEISIDLIVRKEAENTLLELAKFYFDGIGNLESIKGITYREGGKILRNPDGPLIEDLDTIPIPDRDLLEEPIRSFDKIYPRIISARGCPFNCAFCYEGCAGSKYRMRSAENVLKEIDYLLQRGTTSFIGFVDDTFTVNLERTMKICRGLRQRYEEGKYFGWFAEGRVNVLYKYPKLIYRMSLAGIYILQLGVESGHQDTLNRYKKNITLEQIEEVVRLCNDARIPNIAMNFLLGGPFDSKDIYEKTLTFAKKLMNLAPGRLQITSSLLAPFPGTKIKENPEKFGLTIIDPECRFGMTNENCFCETEYLNKYELIKLKREFDKAIINMMKEISRTLNPDLIDQLFTRHYGIPSPWYQLLSNEEGARNFFNLRAHKNTYLYIKEINHEDLPDMYPVRTFFLNYNEENLVVLNKIYGPVVLDPEESRLYEFSSGKVPLRVILTLAKEQIFTASGEEEIYKRVIGFYIKMEKFHAVIFAKI